MNNDVEITFHQMGYLDGKFKIRDIQLPASVFKTNKSIVKWSKVREDVRFGEMFRNMTILEPLKIPIDISSSIPCNFMGSKMLLHRI